jgi:hypothetical protein
LLAAENAPYASHFVWLSWADSALSRPSPGYRIFIWVFEQPEIATTCWACHVHDCLFDLPSTLYKSLSIKAVFYKYFFAA